MSISYEVIQRTTRHTSGHEAEELHQILNAWAASGWRLKQIVMQTEFHQTIIFEREKK